MDTDDALRVSVTCDGVPLPDTAPLLAVNVVLALNRVPRATIVIDDRSLGEEDRQLAISDSDLLAKGKRICIMAGFGATMAPIFDGIIVGQGVRMGTDNCVRLDIECRHQAVAMTRERKFANFIGQSESDIIASLITAAGLEADVAACAAINDELVQYDTTDWDFMLARARANGFDVACEGNQISVKPPATEATPVLSLTYGNDLIDFAEQPDATGHMRFNGQAAAKPGSMVDVASVGKYFSGPKYINEVVHAIADGSWTTEVYFGAAPSQPAAALGPAPMAGVPGLQIGFVTQLDCDPQGQQRICVSLPVMGDGAAGIWARLATDYAGDGVGSFFIPEIGDEVVVGFTNNDPRAPVILGSLYSGTRKPPYPLATDNATKALVTKGRLTVELNDAAKVITIVTPARNKLVLSDEARSITLQDQNGNQIVMSPAGISVTSDGDISLSAKGAISLSAINTVSIVSNGDLHQEALGITCKAAVSLVATGGATAELSSPGQTTVRGAMVMIN